MSWTRGVVVVGVLAAGCGPIVHDGGTDTNADSSSGDPTSASTTVSTTVGTSMSTSVGTTVATTASDDVTTDGPEPTPGSYCQPECVEPVDCCQAFTGDPTCIGMLGTYPYNLACDAGVCEFLGCVSDEDCSFGGAIEGWICVPVGPIPACAPACDGDDDCEAQGLGSWTCNGTWCEQGPCDDDSDCAGPPIECNVDTRMCEFRCSTDDECSGIGVCDPQTSRCGCSDEAQCNDGYTCAPPP